MTLRGMSAVLVPATQMVHIVSVWVVRSNNLVNQTNIQAALKKKKKVKKPVKGDKSFALKYI